MGRTHLGHHIAHGTWEGGEPGITTLMFLPPFAGLRVLRCPSLVHEVSLSTLSLLLAAFCAGRVFPDGNGGKI